MFNKNRDDSKKSLNYQLMILFMEQHLKARLNIDDKICDYIGGNDIRFSNCQIKKFSRFVIENVSKNYRELFKENDDEWNIDVIFGTLSNEHENYFFNFENETIVFNMTDKGYRYQFNGYIQSEDKRSYESVKLTQKANLFLAITTIYYIVSFIFNDLDYDLNKFFKKIFSSSIFFSFMVINIVLLIIIHFLSKLVNKD